MAVPTLTPEQRAMAVVKAAEARKARSELSLSQQDLGSWIGDSRKTVVRALADLREMELIRNARLPRHIRITDPVRLHAFVAAADAGAGAEAPPLSIAELFL